MTITSDDNFATFKVEVVGGLPYVQNFLASDRIVSPVSIPGTSHELWKVVNSDGTEVDVERIALTSVPLTYLQIGTLYRKTPLLYARNYNDEFIIAAIGSAWTADSSMPTSGSATYNGKSYGIAIGVAPGATLRTLADFQMTTNFLAGSIDGTLNNFKFYNFATGSNVVVPSPGSFAIDFDAAISGSSFAGIMRDGYIAIGRVDGRFAGPAAEEVAGAYQINRAGVTAHGVFVGKQ
jgi:hypothetical protein